MQKFEASSPLKVEVGRFRSENIFLERYAIVRLIVVEGDPLCLKYYPWIVSLFSFSPPSPPLLCPPPL